MTTATKTPKAVLETLKRPKLDVKDAVAAAMNAFREFYPELIHSNLALEEVDEEEGKYWLITLGYDTKRKLSAHQKVFQSEDYRAYKVFRIDNILGRVVSMKMRTVE